MTPITSPSSLGNVLQHYRKSLDLTQNNVSQQHGIRQASISGLENGSPGMRIDTLFRLMTALGLEMQLVARKDSQDDKAAWE
ncbi:hypothetical protein MNBD_GAMMA10-166 [hydrothermal vent metagenome]|uniref:HTH cro/C1-type domain-containing protein n=1 Tax=hydrothermal vent metagenome TaxID=652676 RepID=A0A3B0YHS4_9ZZZZ